MARKSRTRCTRPHPSVVASLKLRPKPADVVIRQRGTDAILEALRTGATLYVHNPQAGWVEANRRVAQRILAYCAALPARDQRLCHNHSYGIA